jgi:hypothetical protein
MDVYLQYNDDDNNDDDDIACERLECTVRINRDESGKETGRMIVPEFTDSECFTRFFVYNSNTPVTSDTRFIRMPHTSNTSTNTKPDQILNRMENEIWVYMIENGYRSRAKLAYHKIIGKWVLYRPMPHAVERVNIDLNNYFIPGSDYTADNTIVLRGMHALSRMSKTTSDGTVIQIPDQQMYSCFYVFQTLNDYVHLIVRTKKFSYLDKTKIFILRDKYPVLTYSLRNNYCLVYTYNYTEINETGENSVMCTESIFFKKHDFDKLTIFFQSTKTNIDPEKNNVEVDPENEKKLSEFMDETPFDEYMNTRTVMI